MGSSCKAPNLLLPSIKGADQTAQSDQRLCCFLSLECVIAKIAPCKIEIFQIVSVADLIRNANPKTGFLMKMPM